MAESTIVNAQKYVGPGFELVAFDPKTSISLIGREAFESDATLAAVADLAAADATLVEQQACASSRFQFVEGSPEEVDRYCALLQASMGIERPTSSAAGRPVPLDLREEIDGLRGMDDFYRVWGDYAGSGVVIRSDDPVDFHPDFRTVNVIPVSDLERGGRARERGNTDGRRLPARTQGVAAGLARRDGRPARGQARIGGKRGDGSAA